MNLLNTKKLWPSFLVQAVTSSGAIRVSTVGSYQPWDHLCTFKEHSVVKETYKVVGLPNFGWLGFAKLGKATKSSSNRDSWFTMMEQNALGKSNMRKNSNWKKLFSGQQTSQLKKLQPDIVPHTSQGEVLWCLTCCSSVCWPRTSLWLYMCMGGCAMRFSVNWCRIIGTDNTKLLRTGTAGRSIGYYMISYTYYKYVCMYII